MRRQLTSDEHTCSIYTAAESLYRLLRTRSVHGFQGGAVVQRVRHWACDQHRSRVQILLEATLRNNLGQVVHTYVPLSPSSITWYQLKGGDALRLGR